MTIEELKRALVEVRDICRSKLTCYDCPFSDRKRRKDVYYCPIKFVSKEANDIYFPEEWDVDDWKEDSNG